MPARSQIMFHWLDALILYPKPLGSCAGVRSSPEAKKRWPTPAPHVTRPASSASTTYIFLARVIVSPSTHPRSSRRIRTGRNIILTGVNTSTLSDGVVNSWANRLAERAAAGHPREMDHATTAALEAGLDEIRGAPAGPGRLEVIVPPP